MANLEKQFNKECCEFSDSGVYVDYEKAVKFLSQAQEEARKEVREMINQRMRDYANTPLLDRKNAYDELWELSKALSTSLEEKKEWE